VSLFSSSKNSGTKANHAKNDRFSPKNMHHDIPYRIAAKSHFGNISFELSFAPEIIFGRRGETGFFDNITETPLT
jgi:rRNA maturation protein Nop10